MAIFALIDALGAVRELRQWGSATPPADLKAREGVFWLPYQQIDPAFDAATQVRTGPVRAILADKVTDTWTVRAKTAAELDADKDAKIDTMDMLLFQLAFDHENRVRVLEGKAAITAAQFRAAIKARL